jgi:hypothetical protein
VSALSREFPKLDRVLVTDEPQTMEISGTVVKIKGGDDLLRNHTPPMRRQLSDPIDTVVLAIGTTLLIVGLVIWVLAMLAS